MRIAHDYVLWVLVLAAALHVLEEHQLDWLGWANQVLGPRLGVRFTPADFYMTNATLIVAAVAAAAIGWRLPALTLGVPALFVINAVGFHILPTLVQRRFSPGTITAVCLYLPLSAWTYYAADLDGVLGVREAVVSAVVGALFMAYPIALVRLEGRRRRALS